MQPSDSIHIATISGEGRRVALTVAGRAELFRCIAVGASLEDSARCARIAPATLYRYMSLGKAEQKAASELDEFATAPTDSWWALLEDIKAAQALFKVERLGVIKTGEPGWQSSAWLLERKWPKDWGRSTRIDVAATSKADAKGGERTGVVVIPMLDESDPLEN